MIDRVTITGADDSIDANDLIPLTKEFPFVEWGILASLNNTVSNGGTTRYPSPRWISDIQGLAEIGHLPNLALHINGKWVRSLLQGEITFSIDLLHCFRRVQLNFHAERSACVPREFAACLKSLNKPFIFQLDGERGNTHLDAANSEEVPRLHGLFDVSGGAGVLPAEWPKPIYLDVQPGENGQGVERWAYHGYAGGLGPDNLADQIPLILAASAGTQDTSEGMIWIDMETHVRSNGDRQFDLAKVRRCLEIASPYIGLVAVDAD